MAKAAKGSTKLSNSAYVTHSAFWNADDVVVERIKLATLLFDKIQWSVSNPVGFAEGTAELAFEPGLSNPTISELSHLWLGHPEQLPAYDIFKIDDSEADVVKLDDYPALFESAKGALVTRGLDADKHYDDYKLALYTVTEILYWQKHFSAQTFIGHHFSDHTLHSYPNLHGEVDEAREVKISTPSLFNLSWNDIVSLRSSPYLRAFREKYSELSLAGRLQELFDQYQHALEKLADEVRPTPARNTLIGVLSNLPTPTIVNPVGVGASIHAVSTDRRRARKYGWAFFVREARARRVN